MVNTACFRKINLNYFKQTVINLDFFHRFDLLAYIKPFDYASSNKAFSKASFNNVLIIISFNLANKDPLNQPKGSVVKQAEMPHKYLLICCPTVLGFSLKDKL
jgi:hypothetical protein